MDKKAAEQRNCKSRGMKAGICCVGQQHNETVSPKAVERQMDDGSHQSRSSESIREKMGGRKAWFMI